MIAETKEEIIKCSKCGCKKLVSLFKIRGNTGHRYKTCITCCERFQCDRCDAKFASDTNLQQHIKQVHDKIKDFQCDKCEYACSTNSDLRRHIKRVHNKIKDFQCDRCEYACSTNGDLQKYIKTCAGSRNISSGKFKVIQALEELGLFENEDYIHDSTLSELTDYCKRNLRFDFRLLNHKIIIEYDGIQHYMPKTFGGISQEQAELNFEETKLCDKLKDDFCKEFNYKMIRISYKDYPNILSILHSELIDIIDNIG